MPNILDLNDDVEFYQTALHAQHNEVKYLYTVIENLRKVLYGIEGAKPIDPKSGFPLENC